MTGTRTRLRWDKLPRASKRQPVRQYLKVELRYIITADDARN